MPPLQLIQLSQKEGRSLLAVQALQLRRVKSQREAARLYDVSRTTISRRLQGIHPRGETTHVNLKMTPTEEQSLVQWILDLNQRGFPPYIIDVRRMGDVLLAARGQDPPP